MRNDARDLARRIAAQADSGPILRRHRGTVTDVNVDGTVDLTLDGTSVTLASISVLLSNAGLVAGDIVEVLIDDTDVFVLGKIGVNSGFVPTGGIIMWSGTTLDIPDGWALCDGNNGTPNLLDRFVVGGGSAYPIGQTGGASTVALSISHMPAHDHGDTSTDGIHTHDNMDAMLKTVNASGGSGDNGGSSVAQGTAGGRFGAVQSAEIRSTGSSHSHNIPSQGSGTAHENKPPYYAIAFIMRIA